MFSRFLSLAFVATGILVSSMAFATLTPYSEDFEALDAEAPGALGDVGWLVFGNVYEADGTTFLYPYGPFPAPNGSGAFSNVAVGQGGDEQGAQQIVVFNDYNNGDHGTGRRIESLVFQEQPIGGENIGETWIFRFQAKRGDLGGATTALAFLKTLNPNAGFATTNLFTVDTTAIPTTWNTYELSIEIDEGLVGQLVQIGFSSTASNFEPSGVNYDNIQFSADIDDDGVGNSSDNCTNAANPGQQDTDEDGHGNLCDADFNNTCGLVNFIDLGLMKSAFFTPNALYDLDSSGGLVNFIDLGIMKGLVFAPPGPSAPGALCNAET